jgi:hypothetical protein
VSSRSSQNAKQRDKARVQLHSHSFNHTNSSDSDTALHASAHKKKAPLSPITEVNSPLLSDVLSHGDYFDKPSTRLSNGKGFASTEDLDLIPTTDKLTSKYSKSVDSMHSSQMPAERPALTKGAAVNKMIKRLSIERLSPPPQVIQAGGFSYTHPQLSPSTPTKQKSLSPPLTKQPEPSHNDIVYAQVVCNELKSGDGSKRSMSKETVHSTLKTNRESASPPPNPKPSAHVANSTDSVDHFVVTASSPTRGATYQPIKIVTDFDRGDDIEHLIVDDEPIIKPNIRHQIPRYASNTNVSYQPQREDDFEQPYEMTRDMDFGHDLSLSNRREILESRIKSRIGGLHATNHHHDYARRTSTSPPLPPTTKRYHKHGSVEIIERFSPEAVHSPSPNRSYADSTLRKKSHYYSKHDKGDSGIEVDTVTRNNRKNKYSSRFNIG